MNFTVLDVSFNGPLSPYFQIFKPSPQITSILMLNFHKTHWLRLEPSWTIKHIAFVLLFCMTRLLNQTYFNLFIFKRISTAVQRLKLWFKIETIFLTICLRLEYRSLGWRSRSKKRTKSRFIKSFEKQVF